MHLRDVQVGCSEPMDSHPSALTTPTGRTRNGSPAGQVLLLAPYERPPSSRCSEIFQPALGSEDSHGEESTAPGANGGSSAPSTFCSSSTGTGSPPPEPEPQHPAQPPPETPGRGIRRQPRQATFSRFVGSQIWGHVHYPSTTTSHRPSPCPRTIIFEPSITSLLPDGGHRVRRQVMPSQRL